MPDTSLKCYIVTAITMQIKNVFTYNINTHFEMIYINILGYPRGYKSIPKKKKRKEKNHLGK